MSSQSILVDLQLQSLRWKSAVAGLAVALLVVSGNESVMARPSAGHVGGGGIGGARPAARPAGGMPHGGARPSMPNMQRPSMSHPSVSRPSPQPSIPRPSSPVNRPTARPDIPSLGGFPSQGRPNLDRPNGGRPGASGVTRPAIQPPGGLKPATRPDNSLISGKPGAGLGRPDVENRPGIITPGANTRPTRPSISDLNRPTTLPGVVGKPDRPTTLPGVVGKPDRPTTLPGVVGKPDRPTTLPGVVGKPDRPTTLPGIVGKPDRPTTLPGVVGKPDRPTTLPGIVGKPDRPTIGGQRPGDRPIIGGGNNIVNRPGGDNNIVINRPGGNNNIINNNNNIQVNRPNWGWGNGWNNGWNSNWNQGWNNGWHSGWHNNWHDHWYGNHVHHHYHGWYHGCWHNAYWYAPLTYGVSAWGYRSYATWGLGVPYYNPYYVATPTPLYDYSQPIVVNNYVPVATATDAGTSGVASVAAAPSASPRVEPADADLSLVDEARELFGQKRYRESLNRLDQAVKRQPGDPVAHELRALCQFALGDYRSAAATLNALLSSSPGMDWTTMSGLFEDADEYTRLLRRLESHCKSQPDDGAAAFVLAYHYLVLGETEAAIHSLKVVVKQQPRDVTAKKILEGLQADEGEDEATPAAKPMADPPADPPAVATKPTAEGAASAPASTDLVGNWRAQGGSAKIDLTIDGESSFVWKTAGDGTLPIEIVGQVAATTDTLVLDAGDKGTMVGKVTSAGADKFEFRMVGMPPDEPSLVFDRVK
jgi:hypothetical protein